MWDCPVDEYVNELSHIKLHPDSDHDNYNYYYNYIYPRIPCIPSSIERVIRHLDLLYGECLYLVADILDSVDRKPTMLELATMTGYSVEEVEEARCVIEKIKEKSKHRKIRKLSDYLD